MENNTKPVEIILLGNEPAKESNSERVENTANLQVIELSDQKSKMALLRQLKLDSRTSDDRLCHENPQTNSTEEFQKNMDIFAKLPPGTVLIRQNSKSNFQHETDNQRKSPKKMTETTSSGNPTSGAPMENPKRVQRPIKNRKTREVRRNPTRLSKKNLDDDFVNPRQRLLSTKRKENFPNLESVKRVKLSSTPYMNTRSVTRKLYTVGATYHAPSIHDAMEWKEWPVHGMHERPVFHPRFGLGAECNNRFFKSLDGYSYQEIREEPDVEVISSDSYDQIADSLNLQKLNKRKSKKLDTQMNGETSGKEKKTFETCMHTSLHSVLAYCAQVSNPRYRTTIQAKIEDQKRKACNKEKNQEMQKSPEFGSRVNKIITPIKTDSTKPKNVPLIVNKEQIHVGESFKRNNSKISNLGSRLEPKKCLITPRNSKLSASHSKLQDVIRGSSKNALIVIKPQEPKRLNPKLSITTNDQLFKPSTSELNFELGKLDDPAISDETLMEMSSIYEKFVPNEEVNSNPENASKSFQIAKVDSQQKNCTKQNEIKTNERNTNQTSEIAKILSEYIKSISKVPETQNCVLQNALSNKRNVIGFNDQKKWEEKSKISENKIIQKSRASVSKKEITVENKDVKNKTEIEEVLDLSIVKSKEERIIKENEQSRNVECLQDLLENTAILYCATTGVNQRNLAEYINNLNGKESIGWLKYHNS